MPIYIKDYGLDGDVVAQGHESVDARSTALQPTSMSIDDISGGAARDLVGGDGADTGGADPRDAHWRELTFGNELMTAPSSGNGTGGPVSVGDTVTFTVTLTNAGPDSADDLDLAAGRRRRRRRHRRAGLVRWHQWRRRTRRPHRRRHQLGRRQQRRHHHYPPH